MELAFIQNGKIHKLVEWDEDTSLTGDECKDCSLKEHCTEFKLYDYKNRLPCQVLDASDDSHIFKELGISVNDDK